MQKHQVSQNQTFAQNKCAIISIIFCKIKFQEKILRVYIKEAMHYQILSSVTVNAEMHWENKSDYGI